MTIPFLDLFRKLMPAKKQPAAEPVMPVPVEKPSSERLSKTVMPNATRTIAPQDPFQVAAGATGLGTAPMPAPGRSAIAFGTSSGGGMSNLPPAVMVALEPRIERVISLSLADVVHQIPEGYVKPLASVDTSRRVLLKASEIERGMANGKPTVSLSSIYQQMPEIFMHTIPSSDASQVQVPFEKVLKQFTQLQVRPDQVRDQAVPQVETPFLQVTIEDNTRFGTTMAPLQTSNLPPVRVEAATAESLAAAEPEGLALGKFVPPNTAATPGAPLRIPVPSPGGGSQQAPPGGKETTPARIPFKLSPNGTGVPASERVPASSGPSVLTGDPSAAEPARIPFKITPPSDDLRPKSEPWLTASNPEIKAEAPVLAEEKPRPKPKGDIKIVLALKPILQSLPPFQLNGDTQEVSDEARIELPFSLIEPQLATGRIVVSPQVFQEGMPKNYQSLFNPKESAADVSLPLQEVLKNLPAASLEMRPDQEEQEAGENFATPFSAKAEEDAKRFNVSGTPVAKPTLEAALPAATEIPKPSPEPAAKPDRTALQAALDTDDKLDAKAVVAHVGKMAGVKACAIMFGDGLSLAGNFPDEFEAEGLCAMAPSLLQRIENHMVETKLGALRAVTLCCSKAAVTFFMHDNLCLAALHEKGEIAADIRERLARAVHELSREYSNPV